MTLTFMQPHWANLLTLSRLACVIPCGWAIGNQRWSLATALFVVAVVTDFADGPLARRYHHDSPLGGLLDHGTDATFVTVALACLAHAAYFTWLLPVLVVAAFLQYTFDSKALAGQRLRASWLGRVNGIAYFVMVGTPIIRNTLQWEWPSTAWLQALGWLLVASTVASMLDRGIAQWQSGKST